MRPLAPTVWFVLLAAAATTLWFWSHPPEDEKDLTSLWREAMSMRVDPGSLAVSSAERPLAVLGRRLFFDTRFSKNGEVACATCHKPERSFTDGRALAVGLAPVTKNAPTLVNVRLGRWFFWDGRADSLVAQALSPLESPKEHGLTRVDVARLMVTHYRKEYEELFGKVPDSLLNRDLPPALPRPGKAALSDAMLTYALTSLADPDLLTKIEERAKTANVTSVEMIRRLAEPDQDAPEEWYANWDAMPAPLQEEINRVFVRFGMAVAAYERGITAVDSPFDRFASSWSKGTEPDEHFSEDFGDQEFQGFRLFVGKARCNLCHFGPTLSDGQFHNIGLPTLNQRIDFGRAVGVHIAKANPFGCLSRWFEPESWARRGPGCRELPFLDPENLEILGAFKTPTLRNVSETGPYFHDGRAETLEAVLAHYRALGGRPAIGHLEESLIRLDLTDDEARQIILFLRALTSPVAGGAGPM